MTVAIPLGGLSPAIAEISSSLPALAPPVALADNIDPATGEIASLFTRVHPVDAAIQQQFRVRLCSGAAVLTSGSRFHTLEDKTERTDAEIRGEIARVLKPFIDRSEAAIISVQVDPEALGADGAAALVLYRNRLTGKDEQVAA